MSWKSAWRIPRRPNAITRHSRLPVPREKWVHLTMTYDGSSTAQGFRLYQGRYRGADGNGDRSAL
jgi:hypothetical protein